MNKIVQLLCMLLFCVGLSACTEAQEDVSFDDMPMYALGNHQSGETIALGMTQHEVEDLLGKGVKKEYSISDYMKNDETIDGSDAITTYLFFGEGEELLIANFDGDILIGLTTGLPLKDFSIGDSNWCTKYGASHGTSVEDVLEYFGENEMLDNEAMEYQYLLYCYDMDGTRVADVLSPDASFIITFIFEDHAADVSYLAMGML